MFKEFMLTEATRKVADKPSPMRDTKTKEKSTKDYGFLPHDDNLPSKAEAPKFKRKTSQTSTPTPNAMDAVDANHTRAKMSKASIGAEGMSLLRGADLSDKDEISDAEARKIAGTPASSSRTKGTVGTPTTPKLPTSKTKVTIKTTPENMPKIMGQAMAKSSGVIPEWHMVKNLPGYLQSGIRSIGRAVFKPIMDTPIEKIQVLANLNGSGPSSKEEMNAVGNFLVKNGKRSAMMEYKFQSKIPGYEAKVQVYNAIGYQFVVVRDQMGDYIYSYPDPSIGSRLDEKKPKQLKESAIAEIMVDYYSNLRKYKRLQENETFSFLEFLTEAGRIDFVANQFSDKLKAAAQADHGASDEITNEPQKIVEQLIKADPSGRKGTFLTWIVKMYTNKDFSLDDLSILKERLQRFVVLKPNIPVEHRDINKLTSVSAFYDFLADNESDLEKRYKKEGVVPFSAIKQGKDYDLIVDTKYFKVVKLLSHLGGCYFGRNKDTGAWSMCTASPDKQFWDGYKAKNEPIYVIMITDPESGQKEQFQVFVSTNEVKTMRNRNLTPAHKTSLSQHPEWGKWLSTLVPLHFPEIQAMRDKATAKKEKAAQRKVEKATQKKAQI